MDWKKDEKGGQEWFRLQKCEMKIKGGGRHRTELIQK